MKPQNLSVDLSVPGWWQGFVIKATSGWAPSPASITAGTIANGNVAEIPVKMSPNSADYAAITAMLARNGIRPTRQVQLVEIVGPGVGACRAATMLIKGDNIWRATAVLVGTHKLHGNAITVAPDMSGVLLDVPALGDLLPDTAADPMPIRVLTPYGDARGEIHYDAKPTAGCKPKPAKDGPTVTGVTPLQFRAPSDPEFTITGTRLGEVDRVTLNGQRGKHNAAADGKSLTVTFTAAQTASLPFSRSNRLILFKGEDAVDEKMIEVTGNQGEK